MACNKCNTCQGCDTCQGTCYSCNQCNSCQACNAECQAITGNACVKEQLTCKINTDVLYQLCNNSFSFSPCPQTTTLMAPSTATVSGNKFTKATWDSICTWINQRANYGSSSTGKVGGTAFVNSLTSNVAPFKASEFNRVAATLGAPQVSQYSQIKGSYFTALETKTSSYTIDPKTCDKCNTKCNVTCCTCQKCNERNSDGCGSSQRDGTTCTTGEDCAIECQQTT